MFLVDSDNSMRFLSEGRTVEVAAADPDAVMSSASKSGPQEAAPGNPNEAPCIKPDEQLLYKASPRRESLWSFDTPRSNRDDEHVDIRFITRHGRISNADGCGGPSTSVPSYYSSSELGEVVDVMDSLAGETGTIDVTGEDTHQEWAGSPSGLQGLRVASE